LMMELWYPSLPLGPGCGEGAHSPFIQGSLAAGATYICECCLPKAKASLLFIIV
jgi:hypothetical protein